MILTSRTGVMALVLAGIAQAQALAGGHGLLQRADADGNGVLTRSEVDRFAAERFAAADGDRDGALSPGEFAGITRRRSPDRAERVFARLDRNGDGLVQRREYNQRPARIFARLDADKDGRITRDELPEPGRHRRFAD